MTMTIEAPVQSNAPARRLFSVDEKMDDVSV